MYFLVSHTGQYLICTFRFIRLLSLRKRSISILLNAITINLIVSIRYPVVKASPSALRIDNVNLVLLIAERNVAQIQHHSTSAMYLP